MTDCYKMKRLQSSQPFDNKVKGSTATTFSGLRPRVGTATTSGRTLRQPLTTTPRVTSGGKLSSSSVGSTPALQDNKATRLRPNPRVTTHLTTTSYQNPVPVCLCISIQVLLLSIYA